MARRDATVRRFGRRAQAPLRWLIPDRSGLTDVPVFGVHYRHEMIVSTPPLLKSRGSWANPPSEELSAQGPAPILGTPGGSWVPPLLAADAFRGSLPHLNRRHQVPQEPHRRDPQRPGGCACGKAGRTAVHRLSTMRHPGSPRGTGVPILSPGIHGSKPDGEGPASPPPLKRRGLRRVPAVRSAPAPGRCRGPGWHTLCKQ